MRVPVDTDALMHSIQRHWSAQQQVAQSSRARLASGTRIVSAADDAAGLAIAERMRSVASGRYQASRNAQEGVNLVQIADGAMSQMSELLQRMRVFAVQSANGTYSGPQRSALQKALEHSLAAFDTVVANTTYNGKSVLDGSRASVSVQVGPDGGQSLQIDLAHADRAGIGLSGSLSIAEQPDAESALDLLDDAIDELMAQRAQMAAAQQRLEGMVRTLGASADLTQESAARVSDADIGAESARMLRAQLYADVGVALISQVQQVQLSVLDLLAPLDQGTAHDAASGAASENAAPTGPFAGSVAASPGLAAPNSAPVHAVITHESIPVPAHVAQAYTGEHEAVAPHAAATESVPARAAGSEGESARAATASATR